MAERRMFAKSVIGTDDFLDLPATSKVLYFYLMAEADDDGFVDKPKGIMRLLGATTGDMQPLIAKQYVLVFDSGVIVVRHWKLHNYIQRDRYHPSLHPEKDLIEQDGTGAYNYSLTDVSNLDTSCIQNGNIGKDSIGKDSIGKDSIVYSTSSIEEVKRKRKKSTSKYVVQPPKTVDEVKTYVEEHNYNVNPEYFFKYFTQDKDETKWWIDSLGNPVRNWKQKLYTWHTKGYGNNECGYGGGSGRTKPKAQKISDDPHKWDNDHW